MGFKATVKCHLVRELTAPNDDGTVSEMDRENFTGLFEGNVSVHEGIVTIRYEGPDEMLCSFSFSKEEPEILTFTQRFGKENPDMILVLEEGKRHICLNNTGSETLEITTFCHRLHNTVQKNGKLLLSYATELHGFRVEKTLLTLELHKNEKYNKT